MRNSLLPLVGTLTLVVAVQALAADETATAAEACALVGPCGDTDGSGTLSATDALRTLRAAVGLPQPLTCECVGAGAAPPAQLLKTGQTTCYDVVSAIPISCTGTGQDGEIQAGVTRSFADNGDGTITDNETGLIWEKLSDDGSVHDKDNDYNWTMAFDDKITALNANEFAGHDDWRLPNINELASLFVVRESPTIHAAFDDNCQPGCTNTTCSCATSDIYWSSTSGTEEFRGFAWIVFFANGNRGQINKNSTWYVRAVRSGTNIAAHAFEGECTAVNPCGDVNASGGVTALDALVVLKSAVGQPQALSCECGSLGATATTQILATGQTACFHGGGGEIPCGGTGQDGEFQHGISFSLTDNGDGTLTDNRTGLMWEKLDDNNVGGIHDFHDYYRWGPAIGTKIAALNANEFAGHSDWRLPNINELASLVSIEEHRYQAPGPAVQPGFQVECVPYCKSKTCSCTNASSFYWSSTSNPSDPSRAFLVWFNYGNADSHEKGVYDGYVRAVRGGI